jgi:hypothetical protein
MSRKCPGQKPTSIIRPRANRPLPPRLSIRCGTVFDRNSNVCDHQDQQEMHDTDFAPWANGKRLGVDRARGQGCDETACRRCCCGSTPSCWMACQSLACSRSSLRTIGRRSRRSRSWRHARPARAGEGRPRSPPSGLAIPAPALLHRRGRRPPRAPVRPARQVPRQAATGHRRRSATPSARPASDVGRSTGTSGRACGPRSAARLAAEPAGCFPAASTARTVGSTTSGSPEGHR